jgi:hypothetical protein
LVGHFRASLGLFAECQERAKKAATGWLCWQSLAKDCLGSNSLIHGKIQGNFADLAANAAGVSYSGQFGDGVQDNAVKGRFTWLF